MNLLSKFYKKYSELNIVLFILLNVTLLMLICVAIQKLPFAEALRNPDANNIFEDSSIVSAFFIIVILVPLLETLVFQALIIRLTFLILNRFKIIKPIIAVIFSSALFALNHPYSMTYVLTTFFIGIVLAMSYIIIIKRKYSAILITFLIHSLYNMIPFIRDIIS